MSTTVTAAQLDELEASVLFGDDDVAALRRSGESLADRVEEVLDVWYGFVGASPHLLESFTRTSDGDPPEVVDAMQDAWWKSVLMQVALWSRAYVAPEDW